MGIALLREGVCDVERFFAGMKMLAGFTAIMVLGFTMFYFFQPYDQNDRVDRYHHVQGLSKWEQQTYFLGYWGYGYLWGEHSSWATTYYKGCVEDHAYGCESKTTPAGFVWIKMKESPGDYIRMAIFFALWFFLGFGYFFLRRPAPVRFNRKLGAIYTWHRGKLWIHPQYIFDYDDKLGLDLLGSGGFNGPMHMKLQLSRNPRKLKTFKLGTYPFPCDGYGQFLAKRLQEFMRGSYEDRDRGWPKDLKYPWWQRSVLGRKELPEDIDQRAEEWLRLHRKNEV